MAKSFEHHGLFITGTDTGVGKTEVTAGIARLWRRQGRAYRIVKPVATGATWHEGRLLADDTRRLAEAAGDDDLEAITPFCFPEPAAPPVAARLVGRELSLEELEQAVRRRMTGGTVLVEGVGGLCCPLTARETVADLVNRLGLPVVVVARRSLGTLSHTLMTVEVALKRGMNLAGVVVSETGPVTTLAEDSNVDELRSRLLVPLLAVVPYRPGGYNEAIAALAAVDWWSLAR
jgi:dethiobiotin synthetase